MEFTALTHGRHSRILAMAKAVRTTMSELSVKMTGGGRDKQLAAIATNAAACEKALATYNAKFAEAQEATLTLLGALSRFYPSGPLDESLAMLAADTSDNVFGRATSSSHAELLNMHLLVATAGVPDMAKKMTADLAKQVSLNRELDHYTTKVGKLQEAHNAAKAGSARDAARDKLEANQVRGVPVWLTRLAGVCV